MRWDVTFVLVGGTAYTYRGIEAASKLDAAMIARERFRHEEPSQTIKGWKVVKHD